MRDTKLGDLDDEQYRAVSKAALDLYNAAEHLTEDAVAVWPWPESADILRREMAGSLNDLASRLRGDAEG
jgi:hypothetical protein